MRVSLSVALLAQLLVVALSRDVRAATLRVPSDYGTINAALDEAAPGDSVLVAPGVYDQYETRLLGDGLWFSSVAFLRGDVALVSEAGPAATTLRMDGAAASAVVLRAFGEMGTTLVQGFLITGTVPGMSGLSYTWGARCIIRHCEFRDLGTGGTAQIAVGGTKSDLEIYACRFENINGGSGSAINQTSGTLLLEDSEFVNCRSGAIGLRFVASFPHATGATIRRCRFVDNVKTTGVGAGIFVTGYSTALIEDSWFEANRSIGSTSGAGAVFAGGSSSSVLIRGNTFVGNYANDAGAVMVSGPGAQVTGNTFWANWAVLDAFGGAAVLFERAGVLRNNVIAGSSGDEAAGRWNGVAVQTGCNIFWANTAGNATFPLDATDLLADPGFCDVLSNDFTVNATSPCLPGYGHPSCTEQIGAWGQGCGPISVEPTTWGQLKSEFRNNREVRQ